MVELNTLSENEPEDEKVPEGFEPPIRGVWVEFSRTTELFNWLFDERETNLTSQVMVMIQSQLLLVQSEGQWRFDPWPYGIVMWLRCQNQVQF